MGLYAGEACSPEGLLTLEDLMAVEESELQPAETDRQWIFPSLRFTCTATVTGWIFTDTSQDVVCPSIEIWNDNTATPIETDYRRNVSLEPNDYAEPISLSQNVYSCSLLTPLAVDVGKVVGFQTRSESPISSVQLIDGGTSLVGYRREATSTLFNTAFTLTSSSGQIPLIIPITVGK